MVEKHAILQGFSCQTHNLSLLPGFHLGIFRACADSWKILLRQGLPRRRYRDQRMTCYRTPVYLY